MTRLDTECKAQKGISDGSKVNIVETSALKSWVMTARQRIDRAPRCVVWDTVSE